MQKTSSVYKKEQEGLFRGELLPQIRLGITDEDAAGDCVVGAGSEAPFSYAAQTVYTASSAATCYATAEPGRIKLDGKQRIMPKRESIIYEGFVSAQISREDQSFETPPELAFSFSKLHDVPALTFLFDSVTGEYPLEINIKAYRKNILTEDIVAQPTSSEFVLDKKISRFDGLRIKILKALPYRRARIRQISFGLGLVFDAQLLSDVTIDFDADPISRRLPQSTMTFSIINHNRMTADYENLFSIDKPDSAYKYTQKRSPVTLEWHQTVTQGMSWHDAASQSWAALELSDWETVAAGGYTERINGGKYYLTAKPVVDGDVVKFTATDILDLADGVYRKGIFDEKEHSLYDLALAVLKDAKLPQIANDVPWRLWEGLRNITTTAPLPEDEHRSLLKLIAHAACCTIYCDRNGYIRIEPISYEQWPDYLTTEKFISPQKASDTGELKAVECAVYSYHKSENDVKSEKSYATALCSDSGETETLDNPLITSEEHAFRVIQWVRDWLSYRVTYTFDTLGNAEFDALDTIYLQSYYDEKFPARILKTKTEASQGGIKTQITAKRLVKQ